MSDVIFDRDVNETTYRLTQFIRRIYEEHTHGEIKGYLVMDEIRGVIAKEERKYFSALGAQGVPSPFHGSVKCSETDWLTRSLTAMIIAYTVRNNLVEFFKDYPFTRFDIDLETYPKYRFEKFRIWKYRRTGDDVSFLKTNIEW